MRMVKLEARGAGAEKSSDAQARRLELQHRKHKKSTN